uniref:Chemokine interleukin-8-like domain-containing protein n=1 Tax=Mola mola TaxID=94237 RepID=A0A3Q3VXV6_MOLML
TKLPVPPFLYILGLCCLTGQTVITERYGFTSCCAMNSKGNCCITQYVFQASFIVFPDRLLQFLRHLLRVKTHEIRI